MQSFMPLVRLWAVLCFLACFLHEAAGAGLRARKGGGDDDGDGGGMGGALAGLFGGGGGGDDGGDDDDDPNMVGSHKKKHHGKSGSGGGVDLGGLEKGLAEGGIGQLTQMLSAMRAAQGGGDTHIKKGPNGEDMYDFRDLDDDTTPMPVTITMAPPEINTPAPAVVDVPSMPTISLPGKGGKMSKKSLRKAERQMKAARKKAKREAKFGTNRDMGAAPPGKAKPKLVVWGGSPPAPPPAQVAVAKAAPMMVVPAPTQATPMMMAAPAQMMAPVTPAAGASGIMQGLAAMRQNLDMLMNQAGGAAPPVQQQQQAAEASTGPLAARIDEMAQNFKQEEQKMEARVETLEGENSDMKKELEQQETEIKTLESQKANNDKDKELQGTAQKAKVVEKSKTVTAPTGQSQKAKAVEKSSTVATSTGKVSKAKAVQKSNTVAKAAPTANTVAKAAPKVDTVAKAAEKSNTVAISTGSKVKQPSTSIYPTTPWDATFRVHLNGKKKGREDTFTIRVHPEWAPEGAKRFQDMLQAGVLDDARFFRVVPGFMVQFGIPGSPKEAAKWEHKRIKDDPPKESNRKGRVTFATSGPNTRTTQIFVNYADNDFLDAQGFTPFAEVIGDGMKIVEHIQSKYKERPNQAKINKHGNKYLMKHFPDLSFVTHVDSALTSAPPKAAGGFIQDSKSPAASASFSKKAYRNAGIATFYHNKVKVPE